MKLVRKLAYSYVCFGATHPSEPGRWECCQDNAPLYALCYNVVIAPALDRFKRDVLPELFTNGGRDE